MISVEGLGMEFGLKPLFSNANFIINERDRIALVGKNGAGKSTLLKVLCGMQSPHKGIVAKQKDITIGYLPQVMKLQDNTTVFEEAEKAFNEHKKIEDEINDIKHQIENRTDYESDNYLALIDKFTHKTELLAMLGAESYQANIEKTLCGLGFEREDFTRPTNEFSGGWRMRIELAKILLSKPDVLLLDEPTNHLDIESIQWLENFIAQNNCSAVIVSHDRAFINNVTNRTIEISCGNLIDYKVKYNEYVTLRQERREQQKRAYENQQKEITDLKDFIERFRYKPTKAVQVQSRIKQLEKIVPIEIEPEDNSAMKLKFPPCNRSGDYPVICDNVGKIYGEHIVFENVNLTLKRGEKVAFVGRNGEGKSTLVKCLMNEIEYTGNLKIGHNIEIGYFAQNQAQLLDENLTVFQTIDNVAKGDIRLRINDILGAFMFGGEESDKKVKVLSGGERSRLAMIKLLLEPVNMLILDEPTNHLDMLSKDVLKEAIRNFEGTVIIVSHDREFLDGLCEKVYEFAKRKVREHIGGISDYLYNRNIDSLQVFNTQNNNKQNVNNDEKNTEKAEAKQNYAERKEQQKQIKRIEKAVKECETKIDELEKQLKNIDEKLCLPENAANMELIDKYTNVKNILDEEVNKWEALCEEYEKIAI